MNLQLIESSNVNAETYREAAAKRIKLLMQNWTANTLALAAELNEARSSFSENPKRPGQWPGFTTWAKHATGLSDHHITTLIMIHQKFGQHRGSDQLPQRVMRLLIRKGVPESARIEALDRAQRGEHVSTKDAKKIVKAHLPTAKAANEQAK